MGSKPTRRSKGQPGSLQRLLVDLERKGILHLGGVPVPRRSPAVAEVTRTRSLISEDIQLRLSWSDAAASTNAVPPLVGILGGTPDRLFAYAEQAEARGIEVIIAGAGGAAHLPGMVAAKTHLPVIGVPIPTENLRGLDSLLSIVQMPRGIPVATVAIGGAENAGLLAAQILAGRYPAIRARIQEFRRDQTQAVLKVARELMRRPLGSKPSKARKIR
jgi:phosphoribosylaminoimidazole carboxylase PurE protein